ncbi:DUF2512 family protein [Metabacillus arenae]|uniref:DUF2512 family protein n=1 Tax=Metabacillus arenae TaxID=2771434 RepID=A0A926RZ83_9BACI|nr:DUF2512 family protein [Metabacillus arenae]MBD1382550.1 DUF2512 family protein [Metabacillus arenae]
MRIFSALGVKFIITFGLLSLVLGVFFGINFAYVFVYAVALTVLSYLIGDLFLLRGSNAVVAAIGDFGLSFFVLWVLLSSTIANAPVISSAFSGAVAVTIGEVVFHRLIRINNNVQGLNRRTPIQNKERYRMESAEEIDPRKKE